MKVRLFEAVTCGHGRTYAILITWNGQWIKFNVTTPINSQHTFWNQNTRRPSCAFVAGCWSRVTSQLRYFFYSDCSAEDNPLDVVCTASSSFEPQIETGRSRFICIERDTWCSCRELTLVKHVLPRRLPIPSWGFELCELSREIENCYAQAWDCHFL